MIFITKPIVMQSVVRKGLKGLAVEPPGPADIQVATVAFWAA